MIGFDLGSNTLRIVEFDCVTKQRIRTYEKIVRTAKDLHKTGSISEASKQNIFEALREASQLFDFSQPTFCVTTEAMRVAKNSQEILHEIFETFGLTFEIISGEKEAYLTSLAIENALKREKFDAKNYVLFDLGGGSTELTFCKDGIKSSKSFPFGIINTAERFKDDLETHISQMIEQITPFMNKFDEIPQNFLQLVTTAGTPTTVAAFLQGLDYAHYDADKINGTCLSIEDFKKAFWELRALNYEDAERYTGTNRRDFVVVGILIVTTLMRKLGFETCIVIDDGLREGVVLEQCYNLNTF